VPRFSERMDRQLDLHMRDFPELSAVRIFDAAGDMLYTSASADTRRTNIADRPYFKQLRDDPRAELVFSEVLVARASGRASIIAGRALYSGGRFIGVVIGLLDIEHFQHLLQSIDIGRQGLIAVRRSDDFTLALRWPVIAAEVNQPLPAQNPLVRAVSEGKRMATVRFAAKTDGIDRIFSIRTLERYPYYVVVGLASDEVLAGWRKQALVAGALGALLLGLLGFVLTRLVVVEARTAAIVTDLALSSQQLLESEARLDDALEIARLADWEYDIDAERFLLNDRFFRVLKTDSECVGGYQLSAADFTDRLVHPEDAALFGALIARAVAASDPGKAWEEQLRLRCGDRQARWMLLRFQRAPQRDGGAQLFAGTLLDVHERHQAEEELARLALVARETSNAVIVIDRQRRIEWVNAGFTRMTGYGMEEVVGRKPRELLEGERTDQATMALMSERLDRGEAVREELVNYRKNGEPYWAEVQIQPVWDQRGQLARFISIQTDVTARKDAEKALRELSGLQAAIFEAAGYSIISTSPEGLITSFNQAAELMLGYRADEMIGRQTPAIIHEGSEVVARAAEFSAELGVAIEPGFEVFVARSRRHLPNTYEWTYIRKEGSRLPVLLSVTALRDDSGTISGFLGIAADISERKQTLEALRQSEAALNAAQAVAHVGSWTLDIAANRLLWSVETYRIFGIAAGTPLTYDLFLGQVHPADRDMVSAAWQAAMAGAPYDIEHRLQIDGQVHWVRERAQIVFDGAGRPLSGIGTVQEITERKEAELQLQLHAGVFQHSGEALMITDQANNILEINPAFTRLTGYTPEEVRGRNPRFLSSGRTPPETYVAMWRGIQEGSFWQGEVWDRRKDGGVYPKLLTITVVRDAMGTIRHHVASFTDITEQKATEERIRHLALHDALTGLPNRLDLQGRLEQAIVAARRGYQQVAVMFIDLDRFKQINDTHGHNIGDGLLVEVARRLKSCVREADVVARLGGDEFVVVLPDVGTSTEAGQVADKILAALGQPYRIEGLDLASSPSIGIAMFPHDGNDDETLMKKADVAMYRAKSGGRNNRQFYAG